MVQGTWNTSAHFETQVNTVYFGGEYAQVFVLVRRGNDFRSVLPAVLLTSHEFKPCLTFAAANQNFALSV